MQESLRSLVSKSRQAAMSVNQASSEAAAGNSELSARTEQAASSLEQTASAMEQIASTAQQSAISSCRLSTPHWSSRCKSSCEAGDGADTATAYRHDFECADRKARRARHAPHNIIFPATQFSFLFPPLPTTCMFCWGIRESGTKKKHVRYQHSR